MTTTIIILILAYGIGGAICLMLGLVIGAAARGPEVDVMPGWFADRMRNHVAGQRELHEMDSEEPPVRVSIWQGRDF